MKQSLLHFPNLLFLLSVGHVVAGFPSDVSRRQFSGEPIIDGFPDWFWDGVTGLGTAAGTINGWVNDFVFPDAPTSHPAGVPGTTTIDGKKGQDDRAPDIQLETTVAPTKNFGNDCKPVALPGEPSAMVGLSLKRHLASTAPVRSYIFPQ